MINLTPHDVIVSTEDGQWIYPVSGERALVSITPVPCDPRPNGCPVAIPTYGAAELPTLLDDDDAADGVIVSTMFADAYRLQHPGSTVPLFVPDSGPDATRQNGQIVSVRRLLKK